MWVVWRSAFLRKTSTIEWRIVSNWNRGDTSWKRGFTSTLKLGRGIFLRSLWKYFTLTAYFIIWFTVIFSLFYICPSSLSNLTHCVFIKLHLFQMIYIFLCFTLYLDWNFSCCFNGIFYHIKLNASQTFGKNVIILPFLMSYYGMQRYYFTMSSSLRLISLYYTFTKSHLLLMCFNIIRLFYISLKSLQVPLMSEEDLSRLNLW